MSVPPHDFVALSARCGKDPLQVQGPGGNTSIKLGRTMWIKASGTNLADAEAKSIFVALDRETALAAVEGNGDCRPAMFDRESSLRPSIETTFHALLDWAVVIHTHSVSTIAHGISETGVAVAMDRLAGLPFAIVPYRKPGLPLTRAIAEVATPTTQIFILRNHGLVIAANSVAEADQLRAEVERRLDLGHRGADIVPSEQPPDGFDWHPPATGLATNPRISAHAACGSYYPDHVVFLGPALPPRLTESRPAVLVPGIGVALRKDAHPAAAAMLTCLADVLCRMPADWVPRPMGSAAEADLLDWDAEKFRQALAAGA